MYCEAWNEPEDHKRRVLLTEIWSSAGEYVDPRVYLKGVDALVAHIGTIQSGRPGTKISRTTHLEVHHQIGRFEWHLQKADDTIILSGIDIAYFTDDGSRISKIIGFFGELQPI